MAKDAAASAVQRFAAGGLGPEQIGIAVAELDGEGNTYRCGAYRGGVAMYPASVVKLFYLAYAAEKVSSGRLRLSFELERAITDMIVESVNDATGLVLEALTGTTGGPELRPRDLQVWMEKRQAVNRWFRSLGYTDVNACQKTWNEGPYGRERQGYGEKFELRNSLTPNACLRLMSEIALGGITTEKCCVWMKGLLARMNPAECDDADSQAKEYIGQALPRGWQLWSKAGWTSEVRHDVAAVKSPEGKEYVLVVFTKGHSEEPAIIPFVGRMLLDGFRAGV